MLFYSSVNPFLLHIHYVVWFVFLSKRCAQSANLQSLTIKHIQKDCVRNAGLIV